MTASKLIECVAHKLCRWYATSNLLHYEWKDNGSMAEDEYRREARHIVKMVKTALADASEEEENGV